MSGLAKVSLTQLVALTFVLSGAATASAQDPQKLPRVTVSTERARPGPKTLVGTVKDTLGFPIADADISIGELQRHALTNADGSYRIDDVRGGTWKVRARKIGFAPLMGEVKIEKDGAIADFELIPWLYSLPAVVTVSARGGLSGTVADTSYAPVPGATVKVFSTNLTAITDQLGNSAFPQSRAATWSR